MWHISNERGEHTMELIASPWTGKNLEEAPRAWGSFQSARSKCSSIRGVQERLGQQGDHSSVSQKGSWMSQQSNKRNKDELVMEPHQQHWWWWVKQKELLPAPLCADGQSEAQRFIMTHLEMFQAGNNSTIKPPSWYLHTQKIFGTASARRRNSWTTGHKQ